MTQSVLVVDDDLYVRRLIDLYLREAGFDVTGVATGEEALQLAESQRFDVALVDLILPRYGGLRVCEKLKASASAPRVVIITAEDSPQSRESAGASGCDGFLAKPFTREQLLAAVSPPA